MKILRYFGHVFSGKIKHWNETNNVVINDVWKQIESVPASEQAILKQCLVHVNIFVDWALKSGSKASDERLVVDVKRLTVEEFRRIYSILLSYFAFTCYWRTPTLKGRLTDALLFSVQARDRALETLGALDGVAAERSSEPRSTGWPERVEFDALDRLARTIGAEYAGSLMMRHALYLRMLAVDMLKTV